MDFQYVLISSHLLIRIFPKNGNFLKVFHGFYVLCKIYQKIFHQLSPIPGHLIKFSEPSAGTYDNDN